jgi:hypothetical protein
MSERIIPEIAVVGIDIGKTSFHVIGLDRRLPPPPSNWVTMAISLLHGPA